jgi:hypothetical protein
MTGEQLSAAIVANSFHLPGLRAIPQNDRRMSKDGPVGRRRTNSGYRFADSRHATVTERAPGLANYLDVPFLPPVGTYPRPQLVPHKLGPFLCLRNSKRATLGF